MDDTAPRDSRRAFSETQRVEIYNRANGLCQSCKSPAGTDLGINVHFDHVMPWSKGGPTTVDNGQLLCPTCNLRKGNRLPKQSEGSDDLQPGRGE